MLFYHGSTLDLEYLQPQIDPKTNISGIWLTDIKEHAMIYTVVKTAPFLPLSTRQLAGAVKSSSDASVNWSSRFGKFGGATVFVNSKADLANKGHLYIFDLNIHSLKKTEDHTFISLEEKLIPIAKHKVSLREMGRIGVLIKIRY